MALHVPLSSSGPVRRHRDRLIAPRVHRHRGRVDANGLLIDVSHRGDEAARRRILSLWEPGTSVYAVRLGQSAPPAYYLLQWPGRRSVLTESCEGSPLVSKDGLLVSAPLGAHEVPEDATKGARLAVVRGAQWRLWTAEQLEEVQPSAWLSVSVELASTAPLVAPPSTDTGDAPDALARAVEAVVSPAPIAGAALGLVKAFGVNKIVGDDKLLAADEAGGPSLAAAAASNDLRALLGTSAGAMSAELVGTLAKLRASRMSARVDQHAGKDPGNTLVEQRPALWMLALAAMASWFGASAVSPNALPPADSARDDDTRSRARRDIGASPPKPARPGWAERFRQQLLRWLANTPLYPRKRVQSDVERYVDKMLEMFQRGDLDSALRHAIPLQNDRAKRDPTPNMPLWGAPKPRDELRIEPHHLAAATQSLGAGPELFEQLRSFYRDAVEKLTKEGRYADAAFVLAELLHEDAEAVAYLERHNQGQLAAELAEARRLSPAVVVRQWMLVGEVDRAVRIARRHAVFQEAVELLDKRSSESAASAARNLRRAWAEHEASRGRLLEAAEIVHAADAGASRRYLRQATERGGPAGRLAWLKLLTTEPDLWAQAKADWQVVLADVSPDALAERRWLAGKLASVPVTPETRALTRAMARALLTLRFDGRDDRTAISLARRAGDDALVVDTPPPIYAEPTRLDKSSSPRSHRVLEADAGAIRAFDVVRGPGDTLVCALGEAGLVMIDRQGRRLAHFDEPTDHLVGSPARDRALAIASRGHVHRVARLDLVGQRQQWWCEVPLQTWASVFDGDVWFVARGHRRGTAQIVALDAVDTEVTALGVVPVDGTLRGLFLDNSLTAWAVPSDMSSLWGDEPSPESLVCTFDLPNLTYRSRRRLRALFPDEGLATGISHLSTTSAVTTRPAASGGRSVTITYYTERVARLTVVLEGATHAVARIMGGELLIADDRGRVMVFELTYGERLRDHRLSLIR